MSSRIIYPPARVSSPLRCFVKCYVFASRLRSKLTLLFSSFSGWGSETTFLLGQLDSSQPLQVADRGQLKAGRRVSGLFPSLCAGCFCWTDFLLLLLLPSSNRDSLLRKQWKPSTYFPAPAWRASNKESCQCPVLGGMGSGLGEPNLWVQKHSRPVDVPPLQRWFSVFFQDSPLRS